jgi:MFS family permease
MTGPLLLDENTPPRPDADNGNGPAAPNPFSTGQQVMLSLFWFASSAHWSAILITLLPLQAEAIGGPAFKGRTLAVILLGGAFVAMFVSPLFGAWSDRYPTRWGRRKPFLVVGTIGNVFGLLALAFIPATPAALVPYVIVFLVIELFNNLATAPYSALIPDVAPPELRGSASGWMGLMMVLGSFVGGMTGLVLPWIGGVTGAYLILSALLLAGMLGTVLTVREPPAPVVPPFRWGGFLRGLIEPFRSRDFTWVFLTRFLIVLGTFTVQEFLQFYIKDVVGGGAEKHSYTFFGTPLADTAPAATSFFIMALLLGAIPGTLAAGMLSDRYGRKLMVYLSGALQGLVLIVLIFSSSFEVAVLTGIVFGLGYGAYQAVDWALAGDVLPSKDDYAKDMGVWHIAFTLPQVVATPIAGLLLDLFQKQGAGVGLPNLGYSVIFGLAFVYFLLGTVLVRQVKGAK